MHRQVYLRRRMNQESTIRDFLSTRIPPELKERIEKWADRERRSLSQMAEILLEEALAERDRPKEGSNAAD